MFGLSCTPGSSDGPITRLIPVLYVYTVLDQPFDADGGICNNNIIDLSFRSYPILLNTLAITHGIHIHTHKVTRHRLVQDARPVTMKTH